MPDYAGPLQRLVFSRTLWLIVAWPLLGLAWQVAVARRRVAKATSDAARARELASCRNVGIATVALSAVSTMAHAAVLSHTPEGARALFQSISAGRLGCLDAGVELWFDALSATFCSLSCLVALAAAAVAAGGAPARVELPASMLPGAARPRPSPPPLPQRGSKAVGWAPWAWLNLSLAGALVSFLAAGFVTCAIGWTLAAAGGVWLAGWSSASAPSAGLACAGKSAAAIGALCIGAALLFWGLGGGWDGADEYAPSAEARIMPVRAGGSPLTGDLAPDTASLSMTSVAGSLVFVDEARTPLARAPFIGVPVPAGVHTVRVRRPPPSHEEALGRVAFGAGDDVALVPFGASLAFREIADQLVVRGVDGEAVAGRDLESRTGPGGTAIVAAAMVAFLFAAWCMSGSPPPLSAPRALAAVASTATTAMLGPYLLARLAFLFGLTPHTWAAVELVGAVPLLAAAWSAPAFSGARRLLSFAGAVPASVTLLALGAAGVMFATYTAIIAGLATAAVYLAASLVPDRVPQERPTGETADVLLFARAPEQLGELLTGMDRWVVGATVGAFGAVARACAWVLAKADEHVVAAPANALASALVRAERGCQPALGVPLGRATWALFGAVAFAGVLFAWLAAR